MKSRLARRRAYGSYTNGQKRRRSRSKITNCFVKIPGCSEVRRDNLMCNHPTGGLANARRGHLHRQQLQSHSLHASDELCRSKASSSALGLVREFDELTRDTVRTRVQTLDRRERSAFIVGHGCNPGEYQIVVLVVLVRQQKRLWLGSGAVYCSRRFAPGVIGRFDP